MQSISDFANKRDIELIETGPCQFCGALTSRGVYECHELANIGFTYLEYTNAESHFYRFLSVDAHALQHPEIHGRWSNHFHLTRLHLIFNYNVFWKYDMSPKLSHVLNTYKTNKPDEQLIVPDVHTRGLINIKIVRDKTVDAQSEKESIAAWAKEVYALWYQMNKNIDTIAVLFLENTKH